MASEDPENPQGTTGQADGKTRAEDPLDNGRKNYDVFHNRADHEDNLHVVGGSNVQSAYRSRRANGYVAGCDTLRSCTPMLSFLKPIARAGLKAVLTKRLFAQWASVRSRNYQVRWHKRAGHLNIARAVVEKLGCEVVAGPFEGMKYPKESLLSRYSVPHLLGTYERELHPVLNALIRDKYDKLIDIGCAEGYYAVGLAMKFQRPMHAFDTDPRELSRCRKMASLNGVRDLVKCRAWCSADNLHGLCNEACCLIVCDCEGGELDLFTRDTIASITHCDLLIEFHDLASLNTRDSLVDLFRLTHKVSIFTFSSTSDPPSVAGLAAFGDIPLREFRNPNQQWGWFTPIA